jgi:hypothetical protein
MGFFQFGVVCFFGAVRGKARMHRYQVAMAIAAALWLAGCNATFDIAVPRNEERLYAQLYPYYAELCAVSQIKKKPGFGADTSGGPGGHSVLYLNGACRVRDAGYPTIALCAPDKQGGEQGVGLSVNAHFKNANWVATDGPDFFFRGGLPSHARLTRAAYERTQDEAKKKGLLDGIVFHSVVFVDMPPGTDRRDYMYEVSIATDYAIAFGRDRYCARVPMSRAQMGKVVAYLNGVNAIYKDGKKDFDWNVLENNCTHLVHNALAAAGLWREWETERFFLISAFDFPVPKNEFVNTMWRTNDMDLTDIDALYSDPTARRSLMEDGRLPEEPGGLAVAARAIQDNDIYDTDVRLIFYDDPIFGSYQRRFDAIFAQPRYTDIDANLRYFADLYRRVQAERRPLAEDLRRETASERTGFAAFYARFYAYIDRESAEVEAQRAALAQPAAFAGARP